MRNIVGRETDTERRQKENKKRKLIPDSGKIVTYRRIATPIEVSTTRTVAT